MKILAVNNTVMFEGADGLYINKETGSFFVELHKEGHEVNVFQISMLLGPADSFANFNLLGNGLKVTNVKRRIYRLWAYFKAFFVGAYSILQSDFVYIFYPGPICAVLALMCFIFNKKFGLYIRGQAGISSKISRLLYKKAKIIYTISPQFTDLVRSFGGNAFTTRPMLGLSKNDIVEDINYANKPCYNFLYVGRIVTDKGVFELASALHNLKKTGLSNFKMNIVGNGPDLELLKQKITEYSLADLVCFPGMVSDREALNKYYEEADVFILPTYHEGFPRVLYEAMIFGVPIVTTFVGTIPYLMKDNLNCYKISPKDDRELTEHLKGFLNAYDSKAQVAKQATEDVKKYFADKGDTHSKLLSNFLNTI